MLYSTHPQKVRLLYKTILRLHKALPAELRVLGDQYAKDEFRRHLNADEKHINTFMMEWTNYAICLTEQIGLKGMHKTKPVGSHLKETDLENFSTEQICQLHELYKEACNDRVKEEK